MDEENFLDENEFPDLQGGQLTFLLDVDSVSRYYTSNDKNV
jgi:hypothetical protein